MANILAAATATPGHVIPLLKISENLILRGHHVTVLTGKLFQAQVERIGADFVPFDERVDFDYRNLERHFPDRGILEPGDEQMALAFKEYFAASIPVLDEQLRFLIASLEPDLLLAENGFYGLLPLLSGSGARPPVICMGVTPLSYSSRDSVFYGPRIPPTVLPPALLRKQLVDESTQRMLDEVQTCFDSAVLGRGCKALEKPFFDEMVTRPERFLQLSTHAFEYPREELPASVHFVGPLRRPGVPDEKRHAFFEKPDQRPLVVVTQGTLANVDLSQLIVPTIQALSDEPVRVLAATGGREHDGLGDRLPSNAHIMHFDDFDAWLAEAAVLITNGGYGSIQLALDAGVPVIVAGTGEDKKETATRVVFAGCGIDLKTSFPDETQLRDAVRQVISRPTYRQRAAMIREDFAAHDAFEDIARHVELLAQAP